MDGRRKGGGLVGAANPHEIRWFRQGGESKKAYEAFALYRDLGAGRSLAKVAGCIGKSLELMKRWSGRHEWVDRAAAFDANEEWEHLVATSQQRRQMRLNDAKIARMFKQKVVERLRALDAGDLSPAQLVRWFEVAVKVERLALGEGTEQIAHVPHWETEESDFQKAIEKDPELASYAAKLLEATRAVRDEGYRPPGN